MAMKNGATNAWPRADIDSGETGSKVAVQDPSGAPLGTDDEAAGNTPPDGPTKPAREEVAPPSPRVDDEIGGDDRKIMRRQE